MKRLLNILIIIAILVVPTLVLAQAQMDVMPNMGAYKGQTVRIVSTDTAALLETAYNASSGVTAITFTTKPSVKGALITCETADIRIAFGSTPTQGATPIGHVIAAGTPSFFVSPSMLQRMKIISKTASTPGIFQVTLIY